MTITLSADVEASLQKTAQERNLSPEQLAEELIRNGLGIRKPPFEPRDEWERRLLSIATDCGISLSDEALSREEMYD